jgi:hypothetical protein
MVAVFTCHICGSVTQVDQPTKLARSLAAFGEQHRHSNYPFAVAALVGTESITLADPNQEPAGAVRREAPSTP